MRIATWNVNGLRSCIGKGFMDFFKKANADIYCVQETKLQNGGESIKTDGYPQFWNDAEKKGYAGTAVFSRIKPVSTAFGIKGEPDNEGRVITLEYKEFYLVNAYVPNSQEELRRLSYRLKWDERFREYLISLDKYKPVIACGDFNVAHQNIDIRNAASNRMHAGFTDEEREGFSSLLNAGFMDAFRGLYPFERDRYTYWSYMGNARQRNTGWRIDYFCISKRLASELKGVTIHSAVYGSDHCPVELEIF